MTAGFNNSNTRQALAALYQGATQQQMRQLYLTQAMQSNTSSTPTLGSMFGGSGGLGAGTYTTAATTTVTTSAATTMVTPTWYPVDSDDYGNDNLHVTLRDGEERKIHLPDGTIIDVATDGSFTINDKDAKVTYRANRVRDFNSYINASDKLEAFIKFCGEAGVRQDEMLDIPVKHFIAWLIVEAAKADGEAEPATAIPALPSPQTRCRCGRFISRRLTARKIAFCRPVCLERELEAA